MGKAFRRIAAGNLQLFIARSGLAKRFEWYRPSASLWTVASWTREGVMLGAGTCCTFPACASFGSHLLRHRYRRCQVHLLAASEYPLSFEALEAASLNLSMRVNLGGKCCGPGENRNPHTERWEGYWSVLRTGSP